MIPKTTREPLSSTWLKHSFARYDTFFLEKSDNSREKCENGEVMYANEDKGVVVFVLKVELQHS